MTTFYVDPIGGNDASAGTSFATRWQTLTSGATAARIAPGDDIRCIASPDPTDMGQTATWTFGSQALTLGTAVTSNIFLVSGWTSAVTNTSITTSSDRKVGVTSASCTIATAFTTGKAAYYTLGAATDFSAYQQVSFWIKMTAGTMAADGNISLTLCSDTTGTTVVNTINVPYIKVNHQWIAFTVDTGAALGSSIQSVGLQVNVDRGSMTLLVNNIIACKASSAADSLTLTSLVSKNTGNEPWLGIQSINGTAVNLEFNPNYNLSLTAGRGYAGATATTQIYKREPIQLPTSLVSAVQSATPSIFGTLTDAGNSSSAITCSGGWNRTDMSTQTGDTYISGVQSTGVGILPTGNGTATWWNISKMNFNRFYAAYSYYGMDAHHVNVTAKDLNNNYYGILFSASSIGRLAYNNTFVIDNIQGNINAGIANNGGCYQNQYTIINLDSNYLHGVTGLTSATANANAVSWGEVYNITNCRNQGNTAGLWGAGLHLSSHSKCIFNITGTVNGNYNFLGIGGNPGTSSGIPGADYNTFNISGTVTAVSGYSVGIIYFSKTSSNNLINLTGGTLTSNNQGTLVVSAGPQNKLVNGSYSATSVFAFSTVDNGELIVVNPTMVAAASLLSAPNPPYRVSISSYNNVATDNRIYTDTGTITTDTTTRHTASGVSWKIVMGNGQTGQNAASPRWPLTLPLARVAVGASTLVTASVWVYRSSTSHNAKLVLKGGQIPGVNSDVTATASGAINTWEQLTITFTPSVAGVVDFQLDSYTDSAGSICYVDDFGIGQV